MFQQTERSTVEELDPDHGQAVTWKPGCVVMVDLWYVWNQAQQLFGWDSTSFGRVKASMVETAWDVRSSFPLITESSSSGSDRLSLHPCHIFCKWWSPAHVTDCRILQLFWFIIYLLGPNFKLDSMWFNGFHMSSWSWTRTAVFQEQGLRVVNFCCLPLSVIPKFYRWRASDANKTVHAMGVPCERNTIWLWNEAEISGLYSC